MEESRTMTTGTSTSRAALPFDWRKRLADEMRVNRESGEDRKKRELEYARRKADGYNAEEGDLTGYDCQKCKNKGLVASVMDNGEIAFSTCECMSVRAGLGRLKRSGMENVVKEYTFKGYKAGEQWQKDILKKAVDYAKKPEGWFFIGGQVGAGKTHICTAIAAYLMKNGLETHYMLWTDETAELKVNKNDEAYCGRMDKLKSVDVLYIDDFFKTERDRQPTASDVNIAFELLNSRYNSRKITIISSEKTIKDLLNIDEAIGSRIKQRAGENAINIDRDRERNYRLK